MTERTLTMTPAALRAWRRRLGLTQAEAGDRIGRNARMIGYYEENRYPVPLSVKLACMAIELDAMMPSVADELRRRLTVEN